MKKITLLLLSATLIGTLCAQNNVITYTAKEKLRHVIGDYADGLHAGRFNCGIKSHTFSNGHGVITFHKPLTEIGEWAFAGCHGMTSVTLPEGLTTISSFAFRSCDNLSSIQWPGSVKKIGNFALSYCESLTSITLPESLTSIEYNTFKDCTHLTHIIIPGSVTSISLEAFSGCTKLQTVTIPASVVKVGARAFDNCTSLTIVTVESEQTMIHDKAFENCPYVAIRRPKKSGSATSPSSSASTTASSQPSSGPTVTPTTTPAILTYVDNSLQFNDANGNNYMDANETSSIRWQICNTGKGQGTGCIAKISAVGNTQGLTFTSQNLPAIPPGQTITIEIPVQTNAQTQNGSVSFTLEVTEPHGFGTDPLKLTIPTKEYNAPLLKIVDYIVDGGNATTIRKKVPFELRILLQNVKNGLAEKVNIQVSVPDEVTILDGNKEVNFATIEGGEQQAIDYQFIVSSFYTRPSLPIRISVQEKYGQFAENKSISIPIEDAVQGVEKTITGQSEAPHQSTVTIGTLERDGSTTYGSISVAPANSNAINSLSVVTPFAQVPHATVLSVYNNEFASFIMDRDDSFPYSVVRIHLKGTGNKIRLAKTTLLLNLGQMFQVEKMVTSYDNQILFLIPRSVRTIFLTCGDGCEKTLLYSGKLEGNMIYEGTVEVK